MPSPGSLKQGIQEPHSSHPEQALSSQPQRSFHGSEWLEHQSKQHPVSLQLLHQSHAEQALSPQPQRSFHGSEWVEHQPSHLAVDAGHAAPSPRSQQPVEPHGATRSLPDLARQFSTSQRASGNVPVILLCRRYLRRRGAVVRRAGRRGRGGDSQGRQRRELADLGRERTLDLVFVEVPATPRVGRAPRRAAGTRGELAGTSAPGAGRSRSGSGRRSLCGRGTCDAEGRSRCAPGVGDAGGTRRCVSFLSRPISVGIVPVIWLWLRSLRRRGAVARRAGLRGTRGNSQLGCGLGIVGSAEDRNTMQIAAVRRAGGRDEVFVAGLSGARMDDAESERERALQLVAGEDPATPRGGRAPRRASGGTRGELAAPSSSRDRCTGRRCGLLHPRTRRVDGAGAWRPRTHLARRRARCRGREMPGQRRSPRSRP